MTTEIEAQVLNINYDDVITEIKKFGAIQKYDWVKFRIAVFHPCLTIEEQKEKYGFIFTRIRDEGMGKVTITTKVKTKTSEKFVDEYEIETKNSFDECRKLLTANHLNMKAYQERLRQKWIIPNRPEIKEIVFDIWPGLPLYMEVEANTEKDLTNFLDEINVDKKMIRYTGASAFYEEIIGVSKDDINFNIPKLDFKHVNEILKEYVTKADEFNQILIKQKEFLSKIGFDKLFEGGKSRKVKKSSRKSSRK